MLRLDGWAGVSAALLLLHAFTSTFCDQLFVYWIPQFLREGKGLDNIQMGIFASLPLIGGALGGLVGGAANDLLMPRVGRRYSRSAVGFTGKLCSAGLVAASVLIDDGRLVMVALFVAKLFTDMSQPMVWGTVTDISGRASGTVFGVVNSVGSVAAFVAGPMIGWVKQDYGWPAVFVGIGLVYVVSALCWLFIDCTHRLVVEPPAPRE